LQQELNRSTRILLITHGNPLSLYPRLYSAQIETKNPETTEIKSNDKNADTNRENEEGGSTSTPGAEIATRSQVESEAPRRNPQYELEDTFTPYRFVYPEFLPDPNMKYRNRIREKLERIDMLKRREHVDIPEFYVGSILKTSVSDKYAVGKTNEFVGICTERGGNGLRAWFILRNVIDHQGIEIKYDMYSPIVQSIKVLKLEKRLDENLRYLRDCALEYSTFPLDMQPVFHSPDAPVPINTVKVKLNPKPWIAKWHLWDLKGVEDFSDQIQDWERNRLKTYQFQTAIEWKDYDLMKAYRATIPAEEQTEIYSEIHAKLASLTQTLRKQKRKRSFVKPEKTA